MGYFASRENILHRLDLAGYSSKIVQERFDEWLKKERETYQGYLAEKEDWAAPTAAALERFGFEEWKKRAAKILPTRFDEKYLEGKYDDDIDENMRETDGGWLFFDPDLMVCVRGLLEACIDTKELHLDITPLINGGWIEQDEKICRHARKSHTQNRSILESAVIITEGSTDIIVLKRSLQKLYPYLNDYITFFDFESTKPDGGASYLVKFIRAFAAARIGTKIIAIFDNDAVGVEAWQSISKIIIPENIKAIILPNIDLAKSYPTIGPQGMHDMDVNGKAVSIEFFLGRQHLLASDNTLTPVEWHAPVPKVKCYQGVLQDKPNILDRFLKETAKEKDHGEYQLQYPELVLLWEHIFSLLRDEYVPNFKASN